MSYLTHCIELLRGLRWESMLDVGCGDGRLVSMATSEFQGRTIVGIDFSGRAITLANAMSPHCNFLSGDITDEALFDKKFEVVTCIETLEHIDPAFFPKFIAGIRRHVKTNGVLIVTVPSTNKVLQEKHFRHFTKEGLSSELKPHFEAQRIYYVNSQTAMLRAIECVLMNRFYIVRSPRLWGVFYRFYQSRHFYSAANKGLRVVGVFRAI